MRLDADPAEAARRDDQTLPFEATFLVETYAVRALSRCDPVRVFRMERMEIRAALPLRPP
ncbi:MAG: hypothetical protein FJ249_00120 [Nitrospira sp.]|nr:hypothetical protein [Nitrospira sp.]